MGGHAQVVGAFRTAGGNQRADVIVDVFLESIGGGFAHAGVAGSHLVKTDNHGHLGDSVIEVRFETGSLIRIWRSLNLIEALRFGSASTEAPATFWSFKAP